MVHQASSRFWDRYDELTKEVQERAVMVETDLPFSGPEEALES